MLRIAIVEDMRTDAEVILGFVSRYAAENQQEMKWQLFHDGDSFLKACKTGFDIVLMDIEMPGSNGMEIARQLRSIDEKAVLLFVTHMINYAVEGYAVRALDFLVKPLEYENFQIKLNRAIEIFEKNKGFDLTIHTPTGLRKVSTDDIMFIEVMDHTLLLHLKNEEQSMRGSIKVLEEKLAPYGFVRCNNSYLVNLSHVLELDGNDVIINKQRIPIGRTKKKVFLQRLTEYFGDTVL